MKLPFMLGGSRQIDVLMLKVWTGAAESAIMCMHEIDDRYTVDEPPTFGLQVATDGRNVLSRHADSWHDVLLNAV